MRFLLLWHIDITNCNRLSVAVLGLLIRILENLDNVVFCRLLEIFKRSLLVNDARVQSVVISFNIRLNGLFWINSLVVFCIFLISRRHTVPLFNLYFLRVLIPSKVVLGLDIMSSVSCIAGIVSDKHVLLIYQNIHDQAHLGTFVSFTLRELTEHAVIRDCSEHFSAPIEACTQFLVFENNLKLFSSLVSTVMLAVLAHKLLPKLVQTRHFIAQHQTQRQAAFV